MSELIRREDAINAVEMFFKDAYIEDADVHCNDMVYEINHIPAASPWHRVEEELPKDGETVLIYCENTGGIVKSHYHEYRRAGKLVDFLFSGGAYFPKYWMPLPEPPKEDA